MKIEAKDLRIGNWVMFNNGYKLQAEVIYYDMICYIDDRGGDSATYDDIQGIPLTPEILEKAGFEKRFDVYHEHTMIDWLYIEDERNIMVGFIHECGSQCISTIQYLHQLQNIIFALTDKELNIEL